MTQQELFGWFTQQDRDHGGVHVPPEIRLLLFSLAYSMRAKDILELGADFGITTRALALTGAEVIGVDNFPTDNQRKAATNNTIDFPNCLLVQQDAIEFLADQSDESFDFIFVDDRHETEHVEVEAKEVKRILRPGGIAVFHDVIYHPDLWGVVCKTFADWFIWKVPAISPVMNQDFGLAVVQKPE